MSRAILILNACVTSAWCRCPVRSSARTFGTGSTSPFLTEKHCRTLPTAHWAVAQVARLRSQELSAVESFLVFVKGHRRKSTMLRFPVSVLLRRHTRNSLGRKRVRAEQEGMPVAVAQPHAVGSDRTYLTNSTAMSTGMFPVTVVARRCTGPILGTPSTIPLAT